MFGEEMGLEDWDGISELRIFKVLSTYKTKI